MRVVAPTLTAAFILVLGLGGCATRANTDSTDQSAASASASKAKKADSGFFSGRSRQGSGDTGIGVNAYLWRATLDTLDFMPLIDSDPFGGTYVTDWHSVAEKPDERFKVQVYILDTRLRADGLSVQVFRQTKDASGGWVDANVDPDTAIQIENAILTRARQLRIAQLETR